MLSEQLITQIAGRLETMPPKPTSRRELELLMSAIEAKIRAAQERGATCAEIAAQISESGYPIKTSTLRAALQRHRKKQPDLRRPAQRRIEKRAQDAGDSDPVRSKDGAKGS